MYVCFFWSFQLNDTVPVVDMIKFQPRPTIIPEHYPTIPARHVTHARQQKAPVSPMTDPCMQDSPRIHTTKTMILKTTLFMNVGSR